MTSVSASAPTPRSEWGAASGLSRPVAWLRSEPFDVTLIGGTAALGLIAALAVGAEPRLFGPLLFADLWLLGYHHVVSTYTRLAFDAESFQRYRPLILWLPLAVLGIVAALALGVGTWTIPTIYLYWQWWHYTRQSYGVSQLYRRKAGGTGAAPWGMRGVIYALPLTGILYRSHQEPQAFLGLDLRFVPVPELLVEIAAAVAILTVAWWMLEMWRSWRAGRLAVAYHAYLFSHLTIFGVGYLALSNIDHGWLTINIWHNAQYVLIVWLFNNNRFQNRVDPRHHFLSTLSLRRNMVLYFAASLLISTVGYLTLAGIFALVSFSAMPLVLIVYMTINFHHYIVDAIIWKVRKPRIRANLDVADAA